MALKNEVQKQIYIQERSLLEQEEKNSGIVTACTNTHSQIESVY